MSSHRWLLARLPLALICLTALSCSATSGGDKQTGEKAAVEPPLPALDLPAPTADEHTRTAVFAGGCFWCVQEIYEETKGVKSVVSGYAGGTAETATYDRYHDSNHAEAVKITYDPHVVTYGHLLRILFGSSEPTVKDRQGPDAGHGYRMAVFYENDDQRKVAEAYIKQLTDAKFYSEPIQTTVEPMPNGFFPAEDYHQHYYRLHPENPYVAGVSTPKVTRIREAEVSEKLTGRPAPDFTLAGTDGTTVKLSALKGNVIVLDFWATWCAACVQSLPQLNQLWESNRSAGVKVFAINVKEGKDDVAKFVASNHFTFPVLMDTDGVAADAYDAGGLPQTVVIGKDGNVKEVFVGIGEETEQAIREAVKAALSEK